MINVETTKKQLIVELEALRRHVAELEKLETERKQVEEELRRAEQEKAAILDSMSEVVIFQDREHRLIWANKAAGESLDLSPEQLVGRYCYEIWHKRSKPCVGCPVAKACEMGQPQASEMTTPDGRVWFIRGYPIRDANGDIAGLVESALDITKRKQVEEELQAEKNKLQSVVDAIEYGLTIQDTDYNIIYQNELLTKIVGHHLGEKCYRVYEGKEKVCDGCPVEKAFRDGKSHTSERKVVMPSGEINFWENTANPVRDARGEIVSCLEITRNITERKQAEEALQQSEENLKAYLERAPDGVYINDLKGTFLYGNKKAEEITGYKREELVGNSFLKLNLLPAKYLAKAGKLLALNAIGKPTGPDEFEMIRKDGSRVWIEINTTPIKQEGKVVVIGFVRDITERKQAREALREGEKKYKLLFESTLDGMFVLDAETMKIVLANQAAAKIYGFDSAEDAVGTKPLDFVPPEDRERVIRIIAEDMFGNDLRRVNEFRTITKDGREIWISAVGTRTEYQGRLAGLVTIRDITERRQAEEALQEKNEQLGVQNEELRALNEEMLTTNEELLRTQHDLNERVKEIGCLYGVADIAGRPAITLDELYQEVVNLLPQSWQYPEIVCAKIIFNGKEFKTNNYKLSKWKQSSDIKVRGEKVGAVEVCYLEERPQSDEGPFLEEERHLIDAVAERLARITERRQAEEALELQQAYFQQLFDNSPEGIALLDDTDRVVQVNKGFEALFGYRDEEVKGRFLYYMVVPEDRIEEASALAQAALNDQVLRIETVRKRKDGSLVDISLLHYPIQLGNKTVAVYAIYTDITERKRAAEALELQQAYFQQLFDNSPDAIAMLDDTGRVVQVNRGFETLFGYRAEEVKGKFINDVVVPEDRIEEASALSRAALNNQVSRKETVRKRKDGSLVDISLLGYPIQFDNKTVAVYAIYSDITERKRAAEALELQKAYFQQLFDNSPDAIAMLDDTDRVVQVNKGFETLFGYRAEEVKGKFINDIVVPEDRIEEASALSRAALNNQVLRIETVRKRKDDSLVDVSLLHYPIQLGNKTVAVYAIYSDITERKQMEQQLIVTDRLASVGELVSGIAHELNNPLTGVIGFSQLLLDKDVSDDVKLDLKIIYSEAQRAADVVKGLLTFARKHVPVKQPVNIDSIIEKVLTLRAYEQRVNNIQVNTYFAPDLPEVMADHFQLQQVFLNIVINAEYFMVEAHGKGTLTITTEKVGDIIKTSFTDDGPGITQENLRHLFDPFFTTKEVGKGTGLGLSICHGIITEHGGRIYAESKLGKGTTFAVELPISDHW